MIYQTTHMAHDQNASSSQYIFWCVEKLAHIRRQRGISYRVRSVIASDIRYVFESGQNSQCFSTFFCLCFLCLGLFSVFFYCLFLFLCPLVLVLGEGFRTFWLFFFLHFSYVLFVTLYSTSEQIHPTLFPLLPCSP